MSGGKNGCLKSEHILHILRVEWLRGEAVAALNITSIKSTVSYVTVGFTDTVHIRVYDSWQSSSRISLKTDENCGNISKQSAYNWFLMMTMMMTMMI